MNANAARHERQRDATRADPEFEGRTVAREIGEELDGCGDDRRVSSLAERRVVALGDGSGEVVLGHPDRFSFPCRFAWRSPTAKM